MFIKKSTLIICSVLLIVATFFTTVMLVNPFGALHFEDLLKFKTGVSVLNRYYYEDIEADELLDGALLGASYSANDPYTVYMNKETAESFIENIESDDYTGVGIYISSDPVSNQVMVISPLSDSPAEKAGIASGDIILEIDGEPVSGVNIDEVSHKIRGKEGTTVKMKLLKKSNNQQTELELKRSVIKRETVNSKLLDNNIGYVQITQFAVNTAEEFSAQFNSLVDRGMESLVVDLRNNPGGYMEVAVKIADFFIDSGDIVYTLNKHGERRSYKANKGFTSLKTAILTNNGSASASEVFVGAMKDYGLAKSVGEQSFGKGVTQIPYQFYDGSIMKITDSRYYTPKGICIDHEGISPDIEVELEDKDYTDFSATDISRDTQLKAAIDYLLSK